MISVVIAYRDDPFIVDVIKALHRGTNQFSFQIIIVDDASSKQMDFITYQYPNIKIIRHNAQKGVGQSFDDGVKEAEGDVIVLMGSDVIVKDPSWIDTITDYVSNNRTSLGSSVCLSLDPYHLDPSNPANDVMRYGATIIPVCKTEDLSSDSPLFETTDQYVVDIFNGSWFKQKPDKDISEIPCLMGAFYFCSKDWYNYIGGWDNTHRHWGNLEAYISIKSWLMGGSVHVLTNLETGHVFGKYPKGGSPHGRTDLYWFNKMMMAYTILPIADAERLLEYTYSLRIKYQLYTRPFNLGKKLVRQNWIKVKELRERNKEKFVHNFDWFCDKFGITKNF